MAAKIALFWNDTHQLFSYFLRKSHFFFHIFKNITEKKVWGDDKKLMQFCKNSTFFCIWIFYSRKNKRKVGLWLWKKQFFKGQIRKLRSKCFFWGWGGGGGSGCLILMCVVDGQSWSEFSEKRNFFVLAPKITVALFTLGFHDFRFSRRFDGR